MSDGLQSPGAKVITRRPNRSKQRLRIGDKFRSPLLAITVAITLISLRVLGSECEVPHFTRDDLR